jgi:predicted enzyme related to lactoylglutathione lyase
MTDGAQTIIYPVRDLAKTKAVFTSLLGSEPIMDQPAYVGWRVADQDIGLDPNGHAHGMTGPTPYWNVSDIEASLQGLLAAGAEAVQPVRDVGGGKLVASVKDADGNMIGLIQPAQ